jgi:hypothetical protein
MQCIEYVSYDFENETYLFPLAAFTDRSLHWKETLYRDRNEIFVYNYDKRNY